MEENVIFEGQPQEVSPQPYDSPQPQGKRGGSLLKKALIGLGIIIVLIVIILLILPKQQGGKNATLVWWGLWESNEVMQSIIDEFEKQNPNIKIKYTKQDPQRYRETLITRINNNTGPDIFRYHNTWVPMLSKVLTPLPQDVISKDEFTKIYYPVIQKDLTKNGAIYGIPLGIDSLALFINNSMLNTSGLSVPTTWDEFSRAARKMTVKDKSQIKISGASLGIYGNIAHSPDILSMMFLQNDIDLNKISFASRDKLSDVLSFYTSFAKGVDSTWDNSLDNSELAFAKGEVAMYFGFSWDIFIIESIKAKTNNNFVYNIYPVPALTGGKSRTVASYWAEGVSSRSKNQKEAMTFMHYLTQKETLKKLYTQAAKTRQFGELYPRRDMLDELKDNPLVYPFVSQLENAGSSYFASDTHDGDTGLNKRANTYLENAINAVVDRNSSSVSEINKLQEGVSVILKENGIR